MFQCTSSKSLPRSSKFSCLFWSVIVQRIFVFFNIYIFFRRLTLFSGTATVTNTKCTMWVIDKVGDFRWPGLFGQTEYSSSFFFLFCFLCGFRTDTRRRITIFVCYNQRHGWETSCPCPRRPGRPDTFSASVLLFTVSRSIFDQNQFFFFAPSSQGRFSLMDVFVTGVNWSSSCTWQQTVSKLGTWLVLKNTVNRRVAAAAGIVMEIAMECGRLVLWGSRDNTDFIRLAADRSAAALPKKQRSVYIYTQNICSFRPSTGAPAGFGKDDLLTPRPLLLTDVERVIQIQSMMAVLSLILFIFSVSTTFFREIICHRYAPFLWIAGGSKLALYFEIGKRFVWVGSSREIVFFFFFERWSSRRDDCWWLVVNFLRFGAIFRRFSVMA